ncbi:hypothetical protein OKW38_001589 [Paraburkholderia sp. MM5496-R1]|uniref:hypothetical protein n=1 Tax=Paraburkholderia sp. MM5496-R1 TaxID=2991065 RepID=UPI003D1C7E9F
MPKEERKFDELLAQAPEDEEQKQLVLVGAIARTKDRGTFILKLESGRSLTLPVDAVLSSKLLARSFGSLFVELELAIDKLPSDIADAELNAPSAQFKVVNDSITFPPVRDLQFKTPTGDYTYPGHWDTAYAALGAPSPQFKAPWRDTGIKGPDWDVTFPNHLDTIWESNSVPEKLPSHDVAGPVWGGYEQGWLSPASGLSGMTPFSLAAPHQVSSAYLSAMQQGAAFPWMHGRFTFPPGTFSDPPLPKAHADPQA